MALRDARITEASSLVDLGSMWVTANDSGDGGRLFVVSPVSGRTIGIVRFRVPVRDVEALAPAGVSSVWVGDIGDNDNKRRFINVFRATVGPGLIEVTPRVFHLVYPKGHPNAESMFIDRDGRRERDHQEHRRWCRLPRSGAAEHHCRQPAAGRRAGRRVRHRRRPLT